MRLQAPALAGKQQTLRKNAKRAEKEAPKIPKAPERNRKAQPEAHKFKRQKLPMHLFPRYLLIQ